jgi:hypothetical protein
MPGAKDMIKGLLIEQSGGRIPSGVLWFLFVLFVFSLCTFVFLRLLKLNGYFLLAIAVLLRVFSGSLQGNYYFAIDKISCFYVYYMIGYVLSELVLNAGIIKSKALIAAFFGYWIITAGRQDLWKVPWSRSRRQPVSAWDFQNDRRPFSFRDCHKVSALLRKKLHSHICVSHPYGPCYSKAQFSFWSFEQSGGIRLAVSDGNRLAPCVRAGIEPQLICLRTPARAGSPLRFTVPPRP